MTSQVYNKTGYGFRCLWLCILLIAELRCNLGCLWEAESLDSGEIKVSDAHIYDHIVD